MREAQTNSVSTRISERTGTTDPVLLRRLRRTEFPRRDAIGGSVRVRKYVTLPVQTEGESFMLTPVMVCGMITSGKHYGAADSLIAGDTDRGDIDLLMIGLMVFMLTILAQDLGTGEDYTD